MLNHVQTIGHHTLQFLSRVGQSGLFLAKILTTKPNLREFYSLFTMQLYKIGVLSLFIILLSALFIGMVIALQGFHILQKFGAEEELGQMVALSVFRELGPVITALLFAGRAGSAITAELGLMRTTQQLDCMSMMGVDPFWRVIAPRFWMGLLSLPILTALFNVTAIYGSILVGVDWLGIDGGTFWSNMQASVEFKQDILNGLIKSAIFAVVIIWIAVYQGYFSEPNAAGISQATTKTVVYGSLMTLGLDFILTALMMGGWSS